MPLTPEGSELLEGYERRFGPYGVSRFYTEAHINDGYIDGKRVFIETASSSGAVADEVAPGQAKKVKEPDEEGKPEQSLILGDTMKDEIHEEISKLFGTK